MSNKDLNTQSPALGDRVILAMTPGAPIEVCRVIGRTLCAAPRFDLETAGGQIVRDIPLDQLNFPGNAPATKPQAKARCASPAAARPEAQTVAERAFPQLPAAGPFRLPAFS